MLLAAMSQPHKTRVDIVIICHPQTWSKRINIRRNLEMMVDVGVVQPGLDRTGNNHRHIPLIRLAISRRQFRHVRQGR